MQDWFDQIDINRYLPSALSWATNILLALLILIIGFWIAGRVGKSIRNAGERNERLDDTLFRFMGSVAKYVILAFVIIAVLNRFGVETTSIVALLGAASLAVGLALQGAMSNLAAGVMLMVFRPYRVGDFIDAAGKFGKVDEITLFTTVLQTFDNQQIIIPNGQIWGDQIINHSHHPVRGVDMHFGVAYGEDIDKARATIDKVLADHPHILKDPAPFVEVETLNDSSVDFIVRPFCEGAHYFDVRYSLPEQVKKALDAAGIEIPFPHRKVIVVNENS
ncbi:MAG TPA: mechanosensitive ion channel protein MscS [Hyphomonas sp.]|uniref:mechanosensitive ion channel family protein n=1 Tax=unclassified Hyphomonas TaxID=2630699 RepID=UPI000C568007|nr:MULTISPECIES: mechanosensitive ion channel domain-containing protein [unclassified Hyphomonas]MAA82278.1 mechanosensitive ion channel protein MscS [Hyphomonas sp.]MAN92442.1 mechanosensitive ion channel protein MscS [Hyphomonadaceae bacterium]HAQ75604.1 mechanosensitive ion channel protein MscS [Hyphomonas sp.]HBL93392.1 mechanosensitive ion channel protein MscS [Hyphomonas sp.]HCJ18667.1 mechanosensitive ion channel protein MscS [Hyphomonas sp.]|tara:strand:+ start:4600 stop:5430 length:831 start_codon:yes stop_codon:yes gene_type:complete